MAWALLVIELNWIVRLQDNPKKSLVAIYTCDDGFHWNETILWQSCYTSQVKNIKSKNVQNIIIKLITTTPLKILSETFLTMHQPNIDNMQHIS